MQHRLAAFFFTLSVTACAAAPMLIEDLPAPVHVRYTVEFHPVLSDAEFERMGARVAGRPEHPERRTYETQARRRNDGPGLVRHELWADRNGVVRFNTSNVADPMFADVAREGDVVWGLSQHQLTLLPVGGSPAADAPDIASRLREQESVLNFFLSWGRALRTATPLAVGAWTETGQGLAAEAEGLRMVLTEAPDGSVTVTLAECEPAPEMVGLRWVFEGRLPAEGAGFETPRVFSEYAPNGRLERRTVLESITIVSPQVLESVTKRPPLEGNDAVRGEVTFVAIYDYRKRDPEITTQSETGTVTIPQSRTPDAMAYKDIRLIGWIAAGVIVAVLVFLRIRRGAEGV